MEKFLRKDFIGKCSKKPWEFPVELLEEFLMGLLEELLEELPTILPDDFKKEVLGNSRRKPWKKS